MSEPVICFGQQPNGFFPRRFFYAKIVTARRLQKELGGEIVYFCHDSDHDPRETQTILRHRATDDVATLNFAFANKLQRKYSPLYLKRVLAEWAGHTARQLPNYVERGAVELFRSVSASTVADFCLGMYRAMGLLEGIRVVRSSDPGVRAAACDVDEYFVDVPHEGEIVRARCSGGKLQLHEGGPSYLTLPARPFGKEQVSPTRDSRLRWMQSVVRCTHYVTGAGEGQYMNTADAPEITYVVRDTIERADESYTELPA